MDYWTQIKAPAGNWSDVLGTNELSSAISYAEYQLRCEEEARVVRRVDSQVWPKVQK